MILISHRGNIKGPNIKLENKSSYIDKALNKGYDCEIDVRFIDNNLYLGHDEPQYKINLHWLYQRRHKLWIHCKDLSSLAFFSNTGSGNDFNFFFHENDLGVLTSFNYIWSTNVIEKGILVIPEMFNTKPTIKTLGVCSDYIKKYKINI
jgi:hypothetical protein